MDTPSPRDWAEEFGPMSNAEYDPEPVLPPVLRETTGALAPTPNPTRDASGCPADRDGSALE